MNLRGRKLVATEPGRYYQYQDTPFVAEPDIPIDNLLCPLRYWMRVNHVDKETLTYDSFVVKRSGVIEQLKHNRTCGLSVVMEEIAGGHLHIE
jgi:hypothetical protein